MKHAPSKHAQRKVTNNQNKGICYSEEQEIRRQAIETSKLFDTLPHLKDKPIKYILKNKPYCNRFYNRSYNLYNY